MLKGQRRWYTGTPTGQIWYTLGTEINILFKNKN